MADAPVNAQLTTATPFRLHVITKDQRSVRVYLDEALPAVMPAVNTEPVRQEYQPMPYTHFVGDVG